MIRYVLNYSNRTHLVANDFNEVKWMSIENRIKYLAASHVFNCIDEQAPEYLQVFERVHQDKWLTLLVRQFMLSRQYFEKRVLQPVHIHEK